MSKIVNLLNRQFGKLLVIEKLGVKNNSVIWKCLCDCGRTTNCSSSTLNYNAQKSCGCAKIDSQLIDLVGKKFGSYIVIERVFSLNKSGKYKGKKVGRWKCRCRCGSIKILNISGLKSKKLKCCQDCRDYNGKNNGNWNPKITNKERLFGRRNDPKFRKWKKAIYKRDKYICQITNRKGSICAHHLESWSSNKSLRYKINNGVTILQSVHRKFHSIYGVKNNTKEQFEEFKRNLIQEQIKSFK